MAMFHAGQRIHPLVLPHPARRPPPSRDASGTVLFALGSESADRPRIGHETGLRHHAVVPDTDHVRGEAADRVLVFGCAGRGSYARARPDKHGLPRLRLPRTKGFFEFSTGDLVRAVLPQGKKSGVHTGRAAVYASGGFDITTHGTVQGIRYKHVRLLQRADGYGYTWKGEGVSSRP